MEHALRSPVYLYQGELHLNALELRRVTNSQPRTREVIKRICSCVLFCFLSRQFWAPLPCQFTGLNASLCSRRFASQRRRVRTVGAGRGKSTAFLAVDLIRITRPVHRRSAVNCNLRRPSCRGRIHGLAPQHLKTTQVIKEP